MTLSIDYREINDGKENRMRLSRELLYRYFILYRNIFKMSYECSTLRSRNAMMKIRDLNVVSRAVTSDLNLSRFQSN